MGYPRSVLVGLTLGQGYGVAHQTPYFADLLPSLHQLAGTHPVKEKDPYRSIQLKCLEDSASMKLHYDARNDDAECSSWVTSGGDSIMGPKS
eukprot:5565158-Amphidinium_carterae.2